MVIQTRGGMCDIFMDKGFTSECQMAVSGTLVKRIFSLEAP